MFTELLQAEIWRKKLEAAGYRVVPDAWEHAPVALPERAEEIPERVSQPSLPSPPPLPPPAPP